LRPSINLRPGVPNQYAETPFRVATIENRNVVTDLIAREVGLYWLAAGLADTNRKLLTARQRNVE
jgi:hypothetical protein